MLLTSPRSELKKLKGVWYWHEKVGQKQTILFIPIVQGRKKFNGWDDFNFPIYFRTNLLLLQAFLDQLGTTHVDCSGDVEVVEFQEGPAVHDQYLKWRKSSKRSILLFLLECRGDSQVMAPNWPEEHSYSQFLTWSIRERETAATWSVLTTRTASRFMPGGPGKPLPRRSTKDLARVLGNLNQNLRTRFSHHLYTSFPSDGRSNRRKTFPLKLNQLQRRRSGRCNREAAHRKIRSICCLRTSNEGERENEFTRGRIQTSILSPQQSHIHTSARTWASNIFWNSRKMSEKIMEVRGRETITLIFAVMSLNIF